MGRWLDRALLFSLAAFALYLLFLQAVGNVLLAAGLSFVCCAMMIQLRRRHAGQVRMTRVQAGMILESWACGPDDEARKQIAELIRKDGALSYFAKHSSATLGVGDVFSAWKSHRGEGHLILAATCHSDGRARTYAATLANPSVEILDAAKLIPLIRRSSIPPPHAPAGRQFFRRIRDIFAALPERRPWYKSLLYGLGLMLLYLVTGSAAYLVLAMGMLLLSGVSLRARA